MRHRMGIFLAAAVGLFAAATSVVLAHHSVESAFDATRRIKEVGVQVTTLTREAREQFRQLSLKVHEKFADRVDRDYLKRVYAEIEKVSK